MIKVRVPATSANMGPGFDTMGVALNMYNHFYIQEAEELSITGCPKEDANEGNLLYRSMIRCLEMLEFPYRGFHIHFDCSIPISRGLGSSASCILGGVLAANGIAGNPLDSGSILRIASEIEGHPDNIAPALFGGMVISITQGNEIHYNRMDIAPGLKFCALIPDFTLSTHEARAVLPKSVPYGDAIFNVSRSSLLLSALMTGRHELIKVACQDRLHQPYRGRLIANYSEVIQQCEELDCLGVYLSGAGPTIMVILGEEDNTFTPSMKEYLADLPHTWEVVELKIDAQGACVESQ